MLDRDGAADAGEVLGLWWDDVDLDAGTLWVRRQLTRSRSAGERLCFGPLKSARSVRALALPTTLLDCLWHHRDRQDADRHAADDG
jgi:integrase